MVAVMIDLTKYTFDQLCEMRGQVRQNIAKLERMGASKTVIETKSLTEYRSLLKRLTRAIKQRAVQLPLL